MQLKLTKDDKELFNRVHLLSGQSYDEVRSVYEGFVYSIILSYLEDNSISLPFIGEMKVSFIKDNLTEKGRQAEVSINVEPNDFIKKIVGQIEDNEETYIEDILKDKIYDSLKYILVEGDNA